MNNTHFASPSAQWSGISPLSPEQPWLGEAHRALARLRELPENWDGYGSPSISKSTLEQAGRLLDAVEAGDLPAPAVCPVSGGGLQIEWVNGERELELEVFPDGTIQYLFDGPETGGEGPVPAPNWVDKVRVLIGCLKGD